MTFRDSTGLLHLIEHRVVLEVAKRPQETIILVESRNNFQSIVVVAEIAPADLRRIMVREHS